MPIKVQQDGSWELTYSAPYAGLHVQLPENLIPENASPSMTGFMLRNGELRSCPKFQLEFPGPDNVNPLLGSFSFNDVNNVTHTVAFTTSGLWQFSPQGQPQGSSSPWAILGAPALINGVPVSYRSFANILYYTNGGPFLASWDGITLQPTASNAGAPGATSVAAISVADAPTVVPGSTGPLSIGGLYLGELDNHILLANVTVLDNGSGATFNFPQRLWWSANGLPAQWDPAANTNAGFNDFLDVPDSITGLVTIGIAGFLFRTNGITQFTPTGQGALPFQFDHLWASDHGIGDVFPWSIASYGSIAAFISTEQIYQMSVNTFQPIGGTARDAIMADLSRSSGNPVAQLIPTLVLGYTYMLYMISIPLTTFTRHYAYSVEDQNWAVWDTQGLLITGRPEECWTGLLSSFGIPGVQPLSVMAGSGNSGTKFPTGGGFPVGCPTIEMFVSSERQVLGMTVGMELECLAGEPKDYERNLPETEMHSIEWTERSVETCYHIICKNGAEVIVSESTPVPTREAIKRINRGKEVISATAADVRPGMRVLTNVGNGVEWSRVKSVKCVGKKTVARLYCGGRNFAAGCTPGRYIYTHNVQPVSRK